MRAFAAIEVPEEIRKVYAKLCRGMREGADMGITPPGKMHITLAFFEELRENEVEQVKAALAEIKIDAFNIELTGIDTFVRRGVVSVVYIKIESPELLSIAESFRADLKSRNISFDDKPFRAHLTIVRIKEINDDKLFARMLHGAGLGFKKSEFQASAITLFSSNMLSHRAVFTHTLNIPEDLSESLQP